MKRSIHPTFFTPILLFLISLITSCQKDTDLLLDTVLYDDEIAEVVLLARGGNGPDPNANKNADDDGDGVLNGLDDCPFTPLGAKVNEFGCAASQYDADEDGVVDHHDQCPGTPTGTSVDSNGCANSQKSNETFKDDDRDGVSNEDDLCPNTSASSSVNKHGCTNAQWAAIADDDEDGVTNDQDECPGTTSGESVNGQGCSESQLDPVSDDDNDGVPNDQDECPYTPSGATVNSLGCAASQYDTDSDGVSDDLDQCPNTPNGQAVNGDGCAVSGSTSDNKGELKAFPTAFGGGKNATGGRGGKVLHVTNLNASGPGSFREALQSYGTRTIVFDVSGNIDLEDNIIDITSGNLTIAGQTAPRGGITFTKGTLRFIGVKNIIIRYIRGRPAQATSGEVTHGDAMIFWKCDDVIVDHVSASFGGDQVMTFDAQNVTLKRITAQKNLFSDSFTGVIFGYTGSVLGVMEDLSFLNNVIVDMPHRTPNTGGNCRVDIINNVIYNWRNRAANINKGNPQVNFIANYQKEGRATENAGRPKVFNKIQSLGNTSIYAKRNYYGGAMGNILTGSIGENNEAIWAQFSAPYNPVPSQYFTEVQFPLIDETMPVQSASDAYTSLIIDMDVGANKYFDNNGDVQTYMDTYDSTKLYNIANDISTTAYRDYSSWIIPTLPTNTRPASYDTDRDGMCDVWELSRDLDPNNPNDGNQDRNGDGYTNLEDFLNQVDSQ